MKIHTIDLQFQHIRMAIAAYLVEGDGGLALIETGPGSTLEVLKQGIREIGFAPEDIGHVLLTHIHLDHAGAAGWWAGQGSQIYVHERGARHLVDPSKLLESARMIYGGAMDNLWGEFRAVPENRVTALRDNDVIDAGGLRISAWDTPGHARHHMSFVIQDFAFTGDVTGVRLPRSNFISVAGAPPHFDPVAYDASLVRLGLADLSAIYPTHFGVVDRVMDHIMRYQKLVSDSSKWIRARLEEGLRGPDLGSAYEEHCRERAAKEGLSDDMWDTYEVANPSAMTADGIAQYWEKKKGESG